MHIAILTNGLTALASCHLELSRQLREAGHRVTFVCPAANGDRIATSGESVIALHHDERMAEAVAHDARPPLTQPIAVVRWLGRRRELRRASITGDEIRTAVTDLDPDVLVIDIELHTAIIATADLRLPRALAVSMFSVFRAPGLPPLNSALPPPDGLASSVKLRLAWLEVTAGSLIFRLRNRFGLAGITNLVTPMRLDTVNQVDLVRLADATGVDLSATTDRSQWLRPFVASDLPIICYNTFAMELPHEPPERLDYVGPMIRLDRPEPALAPEHRTRWESIVAARSVEARPRPLVYCTLGTIWAAGGDLLARIISVFEQRSDWDLVIGLGGVLDPGDLGPVPDNVLVLPWAPQLEILSAADVVVAHGGTATLREAVNFGVPSVLFPIDVLDQEGNASRAAHHRLGVVGAIDDPPPAIEAAIELALTDQTIRAATAAMQQVFSEARTDRAAVALLEELAGSQLDPRPD